MAIKRQMARAPSDEEIQLRKRARRRLVGAIALVVAAIVFLPMLLDTKPQERSQEIDIRIPPEDSVEEYGTEVAAPKGTRSDSTTTAADALTAQKAPVGAPGNEQASSELATKPDKAVDSGAVKQVEENRVAKAVTETGKNSPGLAPGGFIVQLGAFASPAKARQQIEALESRNPGEYPGGKGGTGATVYTESLKADKGSGKGEVTRVRVGPFKTREQADAALARLKLQGFDGVVTEK
jgi:DedD protein